MDGNTQPTNRDQLPEPVQPGAMITPNGPSGNGAPGLSETSPPPTPVVSQTNEPPAAEVPVPPVAVPQLAAEPTPAVPEPAVIPQAMAIPPAEPGFYRAEGEENLSAADPPLSTDSSSVSWTASEFVAHNKTAGWYALLAAFAVVAAAAIWLLTKDVFAATVIVIAVAMLAGYAARKPRELQYAVDAHGITVGQRQFGYGSFRSFSVFDEGAFSSIELMPLKRFSPPISVYYDPKDEAAITDALARHLPFEPRQRDVLDRLMHKIRF